MSAILGQPLQSGIIKVVSGNIPHIPRRWWLDEGAEAEVSDVGGEIVQTIEYVSGVWRI